MQLKEFFETHFDRKMPCSFNYGGVPVADRFGPLTRVPEEDGPGFEAYVRTLRIEGGRADGEGNIPDPQILNAALKVHRYEAAVEWWLELSGEGTYDSQIVDELRYADLSMAPVRKFHPSATGYPRFHWSHGSLAQEDDFQPVMQNFAPESRHELSCRGGRSSAGCLPYFNLQLQEDMGAIFAIGWSGQWRVRLERKLGEERRIHVTAEMDDAHFRVQPGETLALPRMLALPWEGALEDSFNAFRRFMRWNILPKYDGKPLEGYVCLRSWGGLTSEIHRSKFENVKKHQLGAELYQIDAGWHGDETTPKSDNDYFDLWPQTVGIWKPLPALYPNGLGEVNRACREAGMGFAVWVEPERMPSWNAIVREHREYFIGPKLPDVVREVERWDTNYYLMLNLGYEPARRWILDQLSAVIEDSRMEVFRIDFNYDPLGYWKYNDASDRRGVTEIKYVNAVYAMLDELLARHPGLKFDNCASGGRRLDYRMFRRSMPMFCRSDYLCWQDNEPTPKQAHTYGLSLWIPAHADSVSSCIGHTPECMDTYRARSTLCSGVGMTAPWWELTQEEAAWYRKMIGEAKKVREYMSEDFHPLTGYTLSEMDWMAFQLHRPERGDGMVMAFRREKNATPSMTFELRGIDAAATYRLTDADAGELGECTGEALAALRVDLPERRSSRILFYEKV